MPPRHKRKLNERRPENDEIIIKELLSLPIAPGLIYGDRSHALRMYKEADHKRIRTEIEHLAGSDLKILSFEDKEKIGRCKGHPWGNLVAARVINLKQDKQCILITIYDDLEIAPSFAIKACASKANWGIVPEYNL